MQRNLTTSAYTTTVYTTTIYSTVYNLQYYLCYGSYYPVSNPASPLSFPPTLPKPMRGSGEASASARNSPQPVRGSGEASASAPTPLSRCAAWGRPAPVPPAGARLGGVLYYPHHSPEPRTGSGEASARPNSPPTPPSRCAAWGRPTYNFPRPAEPRISSAGCWEFSSTSLSGCVACPDT